MANVARNAEVGKPHQQGSATLLALPTRGSRFPAPQNGIFIPGGIGIPAVALAIFSCEAASILLDASLNAAAIRSSAISGSASTLGSMRTLRHSLEPDRVTLTMPPPALPVTS